ncbi:MAG: helix-turn-helix domain-containing protein [Parabacteroides sp.]
MEKDLKKIIGQRLQLLRQEKSLSPEEISERLNLSLSAYRKIEYGETDLTLTRLNKIAEIFNMPAVDLFSRIDGNTQFNNCQHFIGYAQHNNTVNLSNEEDLRSLIKANSLLIEMLSKRIQQLEERQQI